MTYLRKITTTVVINVLLDCVYKKMNHMCSMVPRRRNVEELDMLTISLLDLHASCNCSYISPHAFGTF